MKDRFDFDVGIIGASLAGTACAIQLKDSGARVALVDKDSFPRRKPCGEGLSIRGLEILERCGVTLDAFDHRALSGFRILSGSDDFFIAPGHTGDKAQCSVFGINRKLLDRTLLEVSRNIQGVEIMESTRVDAYSADSGGWRVSFSGSKSITCRFLVISAGANFRASTGFNSANSMANRYAWSQHFQCSELADTAREVKIVVEDGYEIYITPTGAKEVNVAILSAKKSFSQFRSAEVQTKIKHKAEERLFRDLSPLEPPLFTGPLGNRRRKGFSDATIFCGDSCEQFDPIGGMGMTHALLSGVLAGEALFRIFALQQDFGTTAQEYERQRNAAARPLRGFTRLTYLSLITLKGVRGREFLLSSQFGNSMANAAHNARPTWSSGLLHLAGL